MPANLLILEVFTLDSKQLGGYEGPEPDLCKININMKLEGFLSPIIRYDTVSVSENRILEFIYLSPILASLKRQFRSSWHLISIYMVSGRNIGRSLVLY